MSREKCVERDKKRRIFPGMASLAKRLSAAYRFLLILLTGSGRIFFLVEFFEYVICDVEGIIDHQHTCTRAIAKDKVIALFPAQFGEDIFDLFFEYFENLLAFLHELFAHFFLLGGKALLFEHEALLFLLDLIGRQ